MNNRLRDDRATPARNPIAKLIETYNPGVTMLALVWTAGFALRTWLSQRGKLDQVANEALLSLLLVVPLMLVGWGALTVVERVFNVRVFRR
jgi:hypothetical protein